MRLLTATRQELRRAFDFKGRTGRADFWWAYLGITLLLAVLFAITSMTIAANAAKGTSAVAPLMVVWALLTPVALWIGVASLSSMVRRARDATKGHLLVRNFLILFVATLFSPLLGIIHPALGILAAVLGVLYLVVLLIVVVHLFLPSRRADADEAVEPVETV
jgi:uncharacterized membrane protein YhaH (DUF805 family)